MIQLCMAAEKYQVAFLLPPTSSKKVSAEMLNSKRKQTRGFWALIPLESHNETLIIPTVTERAPVEGRAENVEQHPWLGDEQT